VAICLDALRDEFAKQFLDAPCGKACSNSEIGLQSLLCGQAPSCLQVRRSLQRPCRLAVLMPSELGAEDKTTPQRPVEQRLSSPSGLKANHALRGIAVSPA
jgi:hypothetical protein